VDRQLLEEVRRTAQILPLPVLEELSTNLCSQKIGYSEQLATQILRDCSNPKFRRILQSLMTAWEADRQLQWNGPELSAALMAAGHTAQALRDELQVDLVWTGPMGSSLSIRRTDQVLLQMIQECQEELTLVSFAIYKIPEIVGAVQAALQRGIHMRLIAETPESSQGNIPFGIEATFGGRILENSAIFIWPQGKRPKNDSGKCASLHVKGAIADREQLFITSANLTANALFMNMELGTLIRNRSLAGQVERQFDDLIAAEILIPWDSQEQCC
jgi:phosphatidylserine/phosphatidylglycerophosphate/cardiolipin synthase-like enzyme